MSNSPPRFKTLNWLGHAANDIRAKPSVCLTYGLPAALTSWVIIFVLYEYQISWLAPPAIAGFLLVGPMFSIGLFRISRRLEGKGGQGVASKGQFVIVGVVLAMLLLGWLRAATIMFAIYYGLVPFPGALDVLPQMITDPRGIAVLSGAVLSGAVFAAFAFGISAYSLQMMLDHKIDAFSAMGKSFSHCGSDIKLSLEWSFVIGVATLIILLTGFIAAIFVFPLMGFASWHAYRSQFLSQPDTGSNNAF